MFPIGKHVTVINSPRSKSTGPRVGSLGFINYSRHSYVDVANSFLLFRTEVYFYRFGFEQKERVESKPFIQMMPLCYESNTKLDHKWLDMRLKLLEKPMDEWDRLYSVVREYLGAKPGMPCGLLAPLNKNVLDLMKCDYYVFRAWLTAVVRSEDFANMIDSVTGRARETARNAAPLSSKCLDALHRAAFDQEGMNRLVMACNESSSARKEVIEHIAIIKALYARKMHTRFLEATERDAARIRGEWSDLSTNAMISRTLSVLGNWTFDAHYPDVYEMIEPKVNKLQVSKGYCPDSVYFTLHNHRKLVEIMSEEVVRSE